MLDGVDVLLYDIQDIGARTYTYISTLAYVMQAAKSFHKEVWVLDRPNPVGGEVVEGPVLDPRFASSSPSSFLLRTGITACSHPSPRSLTCLFPAC